MPAPAYTMTIGGQVVDTTDDPRTSTVVTLTVTLALGTPADSFSLTVGEVGTWRPRRTDAATIALGYAGDPHPPTPVVTGTVDTVESGLTTMRVIGYSGSTALLHPPVEQTYEDKTAGAIVRDLASQAGVTVDTVADGPQFPAYVVDGRRGVYYHMQDLAALIGYDLYLTPAGKVVFAPFTGGRTVHVLEYARHLLALEVWRLPPAASQVEAWGESPAGSRGIEAWAGLTKDFSGAMGRAGSGARLLLERPALRTPALARAAAAATLAGIQRAAVRGTLCTYGQPQIGLGDAILLRGLPDASLNGRYQVGAVTHRITKHDGFTTTVAFHAIAG